jgi:hypothetical protein
MNKPLPSFIPEAPAAPAATAGRKAKAEPQRRCARGDLRSALAALLEARALAAQNAGQAGETGPVDEAGT